MILVTGGTGLVGAHLLYHLTLQHDSIKAIYRTEDKLKLVKKVFSYYTGSPDKLFSKIRWVKADITDICSLETSFEQVSHVYHAAALVSFNPKDYRRLRQVNIEGTSNVVNLCIKNKIEKLCYVSSIATLGKAVKGALITEAQEWDFEKGNYGYAITKHGAEMEVWRATQEGVDVVIVNPGIILGGGFWSDGPGAIFDKVYKGLKFYSDGVTGFIGVEDVVLVMIKLMQSSLKNERYILVAENLSYKTLFFTIAACFNKRKPTIKVKKYMSALLWRIEAAKTFITGKPPILTRHSARSIHNSYSFSSAKLSEALTFKFTPISTCIATACKQYLTDIKGVK